MLLPRALLAIGAAALVADGPPPLRVLRATPVGEAPPTASVAVTFDRPVAGSLDRSVDPAGILRIEPAVPGRAEWRDPVTLLFRPAAALAPGTRVRVTVEPTFEAMDGSRLARPHAFDFRVRGPVPIGGRPASATERPAHLTERPRFEVVFDAPVDAALLARLAHVQPGALCARRGPVRLAVEDQRPVRPDDSWELREAGGWRRDRAADSLRRVVSLVPREPLPLGCAQELVLPREVAPDASGDPHFWRFSTYGPLRLAAGQCGFGGGPGRPCPTGPAVVSFSTPVKGAEVLRHVRLFPAVPFTIGGDTADARDAWTLQAELRPRTTYAVIADTQLTDVFGQRVGGNLAVAVRTTGHAPAVNYAFGRVTVERVGPRTLGVTHVNVDTLEVVTMPVPDSLERVFLTQSEWGWGEAVERLAPRAVRRRIAVRAERDRSGVYGVPMPAQPAGATAAAATLYAVRITSPRLDSAEQAQRPVALVQVTDLGVHARIGAHDGAVWVTGASDGRPRAGAAVALHDAAGRVVATATTDASGLARLARYRAPAAARPGEEETVHDPAFRGYVAVRLGADRALVPISDYEPDLSPWQFGVSEAWGPARLPLAGAVFTERGIYRPGETVHVKAIVRTGMLGGLEAAPATDSVRWLFRDREGAVVRSVTTGLSAFGTATERWQVPPDAPLGAYEVSTELRRSGGWVQLAAASYRVAEYRPPEFLVDVTADSGARLAGDSLRAAVEARYLFGAPMGRAAVSWVLRQQPLDAWALEVPGIEGWHVGESELWWERDGNPGVQIVAQGQDTLDARGRLDLALQLAPPAKGRAARATVEATVTDVNRQTVTSRASLVAHPASFYLAARPRGEEWFWVAGRPVTLEVLAVRPDGRRTGGVRARVDVVRREWHQVRRERNGYAEVVGEWVSDTVGRCRVTTAAEPVPCRVTPPAGGSYVVHVAAEDERGRPARTSFYRWATGSDWVPWIDESRFRMDVVADRERYAPGDTATILFASPFTDAEAWVTVEREGLLEQRRLRIASGTTTWKLPITERHAPNVFVSIVVARGRSAKPGTLDDPGRPTIRVGYAELRVTPDEKRLAVEVAPLAAEYRPGDTARVRLAVTDAAGRGRRSEVTLWAVDEGVLALTGYRTPDPLDLIYQPRGLGVRLASTLASVAPQVPEGQKGGRSPGGGGGVLGADVLRSRFQTTAFFLGSVVTDAQGRAVASAKLPDNLTTFRVMAVAVTPGDRFGSGEAKLLVTRPLVARPALPRFLRDGDRAEAGVVINHRLGGTPRVRVAAAAEGAVRVAGGRSRTVTLAPGRGTEVRFDLRAGEIGAFGDSARLRFDAASGGERDAVRLAIPLRPSSPPRVATVAGVVRDTASVVLALPAEIDPARSRLALGVGTSPLAVVQGARDWFRVYPYYCTEQLASGLRPLVALLRARGARGVQGADSIATAAMRHEAAEGLALLARRQRPDGGFGLWSSSDWTTPWLTAYVGHVLLDAREAGLPVSDSVLARAARHLTEQLAAPPTAVPSVAHWYEQQATRLADRVMAVDFLSRAGRRHRAAENELLRLAPQLAWEDRARLAEVLARGGEREAARRLLEPLWAGVAVEGRRATLPAESRREFYFASGARPAANLLRATLAVDAAHPLVGPLAETLVQQGRGGGRVQNTQDLGTAVDALLAYERARRAEPAGGVRVRAGARILLERRGEGTAVGDSTVALTGLLRRAKDGGWELPLRLEVTDGGAGAAGGATHAFYHLTLTEVLRVQDVKPEDRGFQVERWYEDYATGRPVTSVAAGQLVRVRVRVTVPRERHMVVVDDPLPAGLEPIDLRLRTAGGLPGPGAGADVGANGELVEPGADEAPEASWEARWGYGRWEGGWWTPFEHRELRDDRVVWFATVLWPGRYTTGYLARATTPGVFIRPPAHAEEMYNRGVNGRSDGGAFTVTAP